MIRHFVHLRFRSDVTNVEKKLLYSELSKLSGHIDGILDFKYYCNISVETPLVHNFLDMFWFDFRDKSVRDIYLNDNIHKEIGKRIVEKLDGGLNGIFVCDIEL